MTRIEPTSLASLSADFARTVEAASTRVVSIEARERYPSSGILLGQGAILSVAHSIQRSEEIPIGLPDGREATARLIGLDHGTDLAVLRLDTEESGEGPHIPADFTAQGLAAGPRPGHLALVVGRSPRHGTTASFGMVSCVGSAWRTWRGSRIDSLLRLDIAPYPGLSGGAVIAADGSLLGLATTGLTKTGAVAIPLATARRVAEDLLTRGRVVRPFLGVALQPVNIPADIRGRAGIDGEHGLIVMGVEPGSPAHQSGMLIGDIIVAIRDSRIRGIQDVQTVIETAGSGTDVRVDVIRAGSPTAVTITLRDRPDGSA